MSLSTFFLLPFLYFSFLVECAASKAERNRFNIEVAYEVSYLVGGSGMHA